LALKKPGHDVMSKSQSPFLAPDRDRQIVASGENNTTTFASDGKQESIRTGSAQRRDYGYVGFAGSSSTIIDFDFI
jgi:hypothetical protein